ncbi:homocysteine S-methyltransferase [Companilactobacillus halodurans]|uniref:S-methylmethionine:homocysteine methyltransferase n=1 Tax=Companilactobacillus halodurans TaxID=2584183 RepID=A0A5P0ZNW4_9LACO|nr:homocysteine S-methyltransferase [Companilactobacillus halodurans]MQS75531.1 homocysteine S-methyltransferase [Companilactobacillus halodurans]MQS97775.1 homocysteine S-methyltransferase [Companilactobacillus halodurans]
MRDLISEDLENKKGLVVDGAMATELEKHGVETNNDLWSATALIKNPEAITAVHKSYFQSGADIAITNTYQANVKKFEELGLSEEKSKNLIVQAVKLAQKARADYFDALPKAERQKRAPHPLVAGSVGPYGAYLADGSEYRGDYDLTQTQYQDFHRQRMQLLDSAGVDLFAFETQPNFEEAKALVDLLVKEFPEQHAWLSFSIKDTETLCDGTSLFEAVHYFDEVKQLSAIGVNCTTLENIEETVKNIRSVTDKNIIVYPNNGDIYDPNTKTWQNNPQADTFSDLVPKWLEAGADLIGGCCRTTPEDIQQVSEIVNC